MIKTFEESYNQLATFLDKSRNIWEKEVIQNSTLYAEIFSDFPIDKLAHLNSKSLFDILNNYGGIFELNKIKQFAVQLKSQVFTSWNKIHENRLSPQGNQNISDKKKHELSNIIEFLLSKKLLPSEKTIIDFCGGAGYFSKTLAYFYQTETLSLDNNQILQNRAKTRHERYVPKDAKNFNLRNVDLLAKDVNLDTDNFPIIGVHACGHLLDEMFIRAVESRSPWVLGIGCCYFKSPNLIYCLSRYAKNINFNFSKESLMLAARGFDISFENFDYAMKVKRQRYLFHELLNRFYGLGFVSIGKSSSDVYDYTFEDFAKEKLTKVLARQLNTSDVENIRSVAEDKQIRLKVKEMIVCNFIRNYFSEHLELLIALDRGLFLFENGYETSLIQLFDLKISPRNIGIFGIKN